MEEYIKENKNNKTKSSKSSTKKAKKIAQANNLDGPRGSVCRKVCPTKDADLDSKMAKRLATPATTQNQEDAATIEPNPAAACACGRGSVPEQQGWRQQLQEDSDRKNALPNCIYQFNIIVFVSDNSECSWSINISLLTS